MKLRIHITIAIAIILNTSCATIYTKAEISKIDTNGRGEISVNQFPIYKYRIHGLQQMAIYVVPEKKFFSAKKQRNIFTQKELSKFRIKVVSLGGILSVNGLKIDKGKTLLVDLKKEYDMYGDGVVKDFGNYTSVIRFVSYNDVPASENLCDFMLTIEDPEGITRTIGLVVHGGFTDSL